MFFFTYLRRELRHRMRQAVVIAAGLGLGIGLVVTVTALSSGVRTAEGKILGTLYGVGTDITVTTPVQVAKGSGGFVTPGPNTQHTDKLTSPTQGPISSSEVTAISRLRGVAAASGGLTLTEIKATLPGTSQPFSGSFQPPVQLSVVGAQVGRGALGPLNAAHRKSGREFTAADANADVAVLDSDYATAHRLTVGSVVTVANNPFTVIGIVTQPQGSSPPSIYIPLKRAQALDTAGLGAGTVNTVYVEAASAAAVGTVSREISRQMPSATVTNSGTLAKSVAGSLATTSKLATTFGTWLAILALLAAFAVASLLTLAAVARRVREFGTLKALGWRSSRINLQVMGETIAMGIAGAALGVAIGFTGALLASKAAPSMTATVQTHNEGNGGFGPAGTNGGIFTGTVGGPLTVFTNPNAAHQVPVPFSAPVTGGAIVIAVALSLGGALVAGSFGGWRVTRLRPAEALASVG